MKRLIVCNDGTWNTTDQEENGIPTPTNVVKLYNALAPKDATGAAQLKYYHPGVGTEGLLDSIAGGAVGVGLGNHIRSAYHWIATHYEPGDAIYLYGFSRGAFAARSLGGFLGRGLLDLNGLTSAETWKRVNTAYNSGYKKFEERDDDSYAWAAGWSFFHGAAPCPIRFIGVWDTVGALGIPDDLEVFNLFENPNEWRFHNTQLGPNVQTARHAMAIDEIRSSFTVTRWKNAASHDDAKEIWFPGVHSDVGGGYANTDLSDGALRWMLDESTAADLAFRPGIEATIIPQPLGVLHNSYKGIFAKLRSRPRAVDALVPANHALFHENAIKRHECSPISYPDYRPTKILDLDEELTVDVHADTQWNDTGLYLAAGHRYVFSSTGEWLDSKDPCDWKGTQNDNFTAGDVVRALGSLFGKLENAAKKLTNNPATDFLGTKRVEYLKWFTLVGAIANDSGKGAHLPNDGSPDPHEYVNLPDHETVPFPVVNPGYLYCFPNDVWSLYDNNHGSVRLTIKRVG